MHPQLHEHAGTHTQCSEYSCWVELSPYTTPSVVHTFFRQSIRVRALEERLQLAAAKWMVPKTALLATLDTR